MCFRKQNGRYDKIRKRLVPGNVNIVYVMSLHFLTLMAVYIQRNVKNQTHVMSTDKP